MKSATTIRMDFEKAKEQATRLEEIATGLKKLANSDLESTLSDLAISWKGDSATLYHSKGEQLKQKILASAANLNSIASTIRSTAARTYNAEMEAYQLAVERTYGGGSGGGISGSSGFSGGSGGSGF